MKQERDPTENTQRPASKTSGKEQSAAPSGNSGGNEKPKGTASPVQFPTLSLPKGGGAIQGIGEKFQANPVTGTGSMSVPIAISPGRSGFAPQLALSYDSGSGNGAFGLGWDVGLPSISRKTQKGLPQYDGLPKYQDAFESDVFLLSGAEDLVPILKNGVRETKIAGDFTIYTYRPRIEGLFAKIEKWVGSTNGKTHWRATTKDNLTSIYGLDSASQIADPADDKKVFSWLLERTFDNKGNVLIYEYKREDLAGVVPTIFEKNRNADNATAQQYLKRVKYGNTAMYSSPMNGPIAAIPAINEWLFELVFDYGEHDTINNLPQYAATKTWAARLDPFSSYRAGYEIRDYRLCRRILMFHRFAELGVNPYLVKATLLEYNENEIATQLNSITHAGYLTENGVTTIKTFPPVTFKYTEQKIDNTIYTIAAAELPNAPEGIDGKRYLWVDLDGEGLSGIFSQSENAWYYKRNLGDGRFGPKELVQKRPVPAGAGVSDYEGNGLNDYVLQNGGLHGYFEMDDLGEWQPFRAFTDIPNMDWNDPNMRSLDLDGDGMADLLITENDCFVWYPSKAKDGFDPARRVAKALDEEQGPRIVFQEAFQTIFLADLSGSGMTDICRIRNGEVCYWPNLGYGRFGAKVTMANAPHFDMPDQFDPARLRLTDIDGAGPTDIIYLGNGQLSYWLNQSGNGWGDRITVPGFPLMTPLHSVQVMDLLGNGTSCLVWSSPLPDEANAPLRYIQLMGKTETEGNKPYLLKEVDNNMGAVTRLKYESSTRFYLDDRKAGKPWISKLPFPVQVLTRQEVYDAISDTHFVTKHAYHHGYFDPVEREFRGFGMVEQWDTEDYDSFQEAGLFQAKGNNWSEESHIPPIYTKTWFHNGFYRQGGKITRQYESEYYGARDANSNFTEWTLEDTVFPTGLNGEVAREAARALKGRALRVEVFALDEPMVFKIEMSKIVEPVVGKVEDIANKDWKDAFAAHTLVFQPNDATISKIDPDKWEVLQQSRNWKYRIERKNGVYSVFDIEVRKHPYTATESNYQIKVNQPKGDNRHTVFFAAENETLTFQYERNPNDPRIAHSFALELDEFGNPTRSLAIVYPRRAATTFTEQTTLYCTLTEADFINKPSETTFYRIGVPYKQRLYELTGLVFANKKFERTEIDTAVAAALMPAANIEFEAMPDLSTIQRRLVQSAKTLFYDENLTGGLAENEIASHGLPFKAKELAYTNAQLGIWFDGKILPADLESVMLAAGFEKDGDEWWRPSGQVIFDAAQFYLPTKQKDIFGQITELEYDTYDLLPKRSFTEINTVTLETSAEFDYRTLQPKLLTDPNGNRSASVFDSLGMVTHTSAMGKDGENIGDADLLDPLIFKPMAFADGLEFRNTALAIPHGFLLGAGTFFYYNLHNWRLNNEPNYAMTIVRETHPVDPSDPNTFDASKVQFAFAYSDGFGRQIMVKVQAEKGDAFVYNNGQLTTESADPRWVGNGRTIFNNKGKPVKQYEPYFSKTCLYESETVLVEYGVTPVLHYDPAGRVVRTEMPDGTFSKVEFTPWEQRTYDQNDTVLDSDWYRRRTDNTRADYIGDAEEQRAAQLVKAHADTPKIEHLDTLGRVFLMSDYLATPATATANEVVHTRFQLDIEGNQRSVTDAKDRLLTVNTFNLLGEPVHTESMDAGWRSSLSDALGSPLYAWNQRGFRTRYAYDALRRPVAVYLSYNGAAETCVHFTFYGERAPNAAQFNLLGQAHFTYDASGLVMLEKVDFKGNPLEINRRIAKAYQQLPDWSALTGATSPAALLSTGDSLFESGTFSTSTTYDALNRPLIQTSPDESLTEYGYNEAGLLENIRTRLRGAQAWTNFVTGIDYDAKGQRSRIQYGNGVATTYAYDPFTFRLTALRSARQPGDVALQILRYTYDPVGNITTLHDAAQDTVFYNNNMVEPYNRYTYDALYRLLRAEGREHAGQHTAATGPGDATPVFPMPNDGSALRTYTEEYTYDLLGNILQVQHITPNGAANWTRHYDYDDPIPANTAQQTNRLTRTWTGATPPAAGTGDLYTYDVHGNMISMPHLPQMQWDYADQLAAIQTGAGAGSTWEYYAYDAGGTRSRKVWHKSPSLICDRIYLGGYEVYRERNAAGDIFLERETLHVMDDKSRIAIIDTQTIENSSFIIDHSSLIKYQLSNHLGSACLELDTAAALISYEEYYPFGASSYRAGRTVAEVSAKRYRYVGKERDESSGLDYYEMRYYASWLCRFLSVDALKDKYPFYSVYQYAGNKPVSFIDLDGNEQSDKVNSGTNKQQEDPPIKELKPFEVVRKDERSWWKKKWDGVKKGLGVANAYINMFSLAVNIGAMNFSTDIITSTKHLLSHPIDTLSGLLHIGKLVLEQGYTAESNQFYNSIAKAGKDGFNEFKEDDIFTKTSKVTYAALFVGSFFIGAGEAKAASSAGKLGEAANIASKTTEVNRISKVTSSMGSEFIDVGIRMVEQPLQVMSWGKNVKGHLIAHRDVLGFGGYTSNQAQKMIPALKSAVNQLYKNINPALTRIGAWPGQTGNVLMHITNDGKMLVTKLNGEFITTINKTSNAHFVKAIPYK